jgi:hypothetical protein
MEHKGGFWDAANILFLEQEMGYTGMFSL